MKKPKFPLNMPQFERVDRTPAQDLAFGRMDFFTTIRFIRDAGFDQAAGELERVLASLPPATVLHYGCYNCGHDVPLDRADLVEDRICQRCADAYDVAAAERKRLMREARRTA